jgi:hypothetical protein
MSEEKKRPYVLFALTGIYLFSWLFAVSHFGEPLPFMGKVLSPNDSELVIFADSVISVYLIIGILKRQRLTLWLMIAYNFLDSFNAISNLVLLPVEEYTRLAGAPIPHLEFRLNTFAVAVLLMLLNVFLYVNRRHFDNKSIYLF